MPQWDGLGPIVAAAGASGAAGGATTTGGVGHHIGAWLGEGCAWPEGNMHTIAACMSWRACASYVLDATRLLIVVFFWIEALARFSSDAGFGALNAPPQLRWLRMKPCLLSCG